MKMRRSGMTSNGSLRDFASILKNQIVSAILRPHHVEHFGAEFALIRLLAQFVANDFFGFFGQTAAVRACPFLQSALQLRVHVTDQDVSHANSGLMSLISNRRPAIYTAS